MILDLGYRPHKLQNAIHMEMSLHRFGLVAAHRRFGKTRMAVAQLIDAAMRPSNMWERRYGYLAPFLKQAKDLAWPVMRHMLKDVPDLEWSQSELTVMFPTGSRIRLYGGDNPDSLRGTYFDGLTADEVAQLRNEVWYEILLPALSDRKGWTLFIGTPKGLDNLFYQLWTQAERDPANWFRVLYRADETNLPWLGPEELELQRNSMPEAAFRQEFLCDFTASSANILISLDMVRAAQQRHVNRHDMEHLPRVIGVDVARFGDDRSTIVKRHGLLMEPPIVIENIDNMSLAARVAQEIRDYQPDAVFIDGGRGEGVIDRLRQLRHEVIEVNFGGRAINDFYQNKRIEMWDTMRQWIEEGGVIPPGLDITIDLTAPTFDFSKTTGKMQLESKADLKDRLTKSPDIGDALALTFAEPVASRRAERWPGELQQKHTSEWNPDYLED